MPQLFNPSIRCNPFIFRMTSPDKESFPFRGNETVINLHPPLNSLNSGFFGYQSQKVNSKFIPVWWLRIGFVQLSTINAANKALLAAVRIFLSGFLQVKLTHFNTSSCQVTFLSI